MSFNQPLPVGMAAYPVSDSVSNISNGMHRMVVDPPPIPAIVIDDEPVPVQNKKKVVNVVGRYNSAYLYEVYTKANARQAAADYLNELMSKDANLMQNTVLNVFEALLTAEEKNLCHFLTKKYEQRLINGVTKVKKNSYKGENVLKYGKFIDNLADGDGNKAMRVLLGEILPTYTRSEAEAEDSD
jgi:hypothetical protein